MKYYIKNKTVEDEVSEQAFRRSVEFCILSNVQFRERTLIDDDNKSLYRVLMVNETLHKVLLYLIHNTPFAGEWIK